MPYIDITQLETTNLQNVDELLATDIYERLYELIRSALDVAKKAMGAINQDFDAQRQHNTTLIDGARGTGKSTVLVNLPLYLEDRSKKNGTPTELDPFKRVHILKPIDPTLLEEHDSLFLQVIVAAVLSDQGVTNQNKHDELRYRHMLKKLEELASGFESVQAQKEERGIDKVRSFIYLRQLNRLVHEFFKSVLSLLDKELLVITIDDVDTSLDRAFENLKIVRRYLNTPLVFPIISGDLMTCPPLAVPS